MKKKVLSMILAASLLLGSISVTASAAESSAQLPSGVTRQSTYSEDGPMSVEEGIAPIQWQVTDSEMIREVYPDEPLQMVKGPDDYFSDYTDNEILGWPDPLIDYSAVTKDTVFEVTNRGSDKDEDMYLYVYFLEYEKGLPGTGYVVNDRDNPTEKIPVEETYISSRVAMPLFHDADYENHESTFFADTIDNQQWRMCPDVTPWTSHETMVKLAPGETAKFTLPKTDYENIYKVFVCASYPKYAYEYYKWLFVKVEDELPPLETVGGFTDVKKTDYFADAVLWAVENGVTSGTSATTFGPNQSCTRAQAMTFLWNAAGKPEPTQTSMKFTDVPAGSYYEKAVQWAVENGITSGTSETTFGSNNACTRAQIVTFLYKLNGSPAVSTGDSFSDVQSGSYYEKAVQWAVENGVTSGTGATTFSPNSTCVRAQIVTFLYKEHQI